MELINTSFLKPIFEGCDIFGINTKKILQRSDLKYFDCRNINAYVPMHATNQFLTLLCENQGIDDIAGEFAEFIQLAALKDFSSLLTNSISLYDACLIAEQMSTSILSNEILKLSIVGNQAIFSQHFSNLSVEDYERIVQINFIYLLNGYKALAKTSWLPKEIHYQSSSVPKVMEKLISSSKTKILLNQPSSAVIFSTEQLAVREQGDRRDIGILTEPTTDTLLHKIEALLNAFQPKGVTPSIAKTSSLLGVSERTLRRKLNEENITFDKILSSWRIRNAVILLENCNMTVNEISQHLHYANAKNFARAFKRTFQVSPSQYREMLNR